MKVGGSSVDKSEKDNLYFIDQHIYNCPFCRRRNVKYEVTDAIEHDTGTDNTVYAYQVTCSDCEERSLHFSLKNLFPNGYYGTHNRFQYDGDLDDCFVAHRPAVLHTLDLEVPKNLRALIGESEEARQSNLLTGASATLRKAIYQLLSGERVLVINEKTKHTDYRASIAALSKKHPSVDAELFALLAGVQELASDLVHEDSWEAWNSKQLKYLTATVREILEEIYAEPARRKRRKRSLDELRAKLISDKANSKKETR